MRTPTSANAPAGIRKGHYNTPAPVSTPPDTVIPAKMGGTGAPTAPVGRWHPSYRRRPVSRALPSYRRRPVSRALPSYRRRPVSRAHPSYRRRPVSRGGMGSGLRRNDEAPTAPVGRAPPSYRQRPVSRGGDGFRPPPERRWPLRRNDGRGFRRFHRTGPATRG